MPVYQKADKEVTNLVKKVLGEHHEPLLEHKVKIDVLMAFGKTDDEGELQSPALKDRGHPVMFQARVLPLSDRAKECGDAEIRLDGDEWEHLPADQQEAVIDSALCQLELTTNVDGEVKYDDLGRPKLRKRWGDIFVSGFGEVARRHGAASLEVRAVQDLNAAHGQYLFDFMRELAA